MEVERWFILRAVEWTAVQKTAKKFLTYNTGPSIYTAAAKVGKVVTKTYVFRLNNSGKKSG